MTEWLSVTAFARQEPVTTMSMFPEGSVPLPTDNMGRSLQKWNELLVSQYGAIGTVPFPEGTTPSPQDPPERSAQKINAIYEVIP